MIVTPKQRRSEESLQRMFHAIEVLLESSDFKSLTIQQIASKAGVAPSLLYTRFKNKKEIESLFIDQFLERYVEQLEGLNTALLSTKDHRVRLESFIGAVVQLSQSNKAVLRAVAIQQIGGEDPLSDHSKSMLERRKELLNQLLRACFEAQQWDETKLQFTVTLILFIIQTHILFPGADGYIDLDTAVVELTLAIHRYLQEPL